VSTPRSRCLHHLFHVKPQEREGAATECRPYNSASEQFAESEKTFGEGRVMKLSGIPTLVRKFVRETWTFGLLSAARKSVKGVASRSGLASIEQLDILIGVVQSLERELSSQRQEEARLHQQINAIQETTASTIQALTAETSARRQEQAELREHLNAIQLDIANAVRALSDETSARHQEGARLREQIDAIQEAISRAVRALGDETSAHHREEARLREQMKGIQEEIASVGAVLATLESQRSNQVFADASELRALSARIEAEAARTTSTLYVQSEAIGWLAEHHWTTGSLNSPASALSEPPLVSIILPVWNRENLVTEAVKSVQQQIYRNWELIVVDDGSTDHSGEKIADLLDDKRIRYLRTSHQGVSAARNVGLTNSRGDWIAYIDSDDLWYPAFLARMMEAFEGAPDREWGYAAKLISNESDGTRRILQLQVDGTTLLNGNVIPMTALMHRRSLCEQVGGFDEELVRLVDWDLVLRFIAHSEPLLVPVLGGQYRMGSWPRISNQESHSLAIYRVRRKHVSRKEVSLRVLYALNFFPQLSETFVTTEIAAMREQGVDISVWSEYEPPVPYDTDVPVLRGDLCEAIAKVRPRMVHVHSLYQALRYAPIAQSAGVPMTVRGHGFEFSEERIRELSKTDAVRGVFLFPHFVADDSLQGIDATKLRPMTCCFNPDLYFPRGNTDHRLVIRTGLASPTKHLDAFIRVAAMCPRHRFVLVPCWSVGYPDHLEELKELNRSLGDPVEMLVNRPHAEVADLMRRAGIHLHTHALQEPYGMPVSIAESMAAGCYIIARRSPASVAFVAGVGKTYDTEAEAAALVQETETWTNSQWAAARLASIERAFAHYGSQEVLRPLLDEWTSSPLGSLATSA